MAATEIINAILAPAWLVSRIGIISIIIAGVLLIYFEPFVSKKIILPLTDLIRHKTSHHVSRIGRVSRFSDFIGNSAAAIFFILYVYFGVYILAEFMFSPILYKLRGYITLIAIGIFLLISYAVNNIEIRKRFMGQ
jgi:hypothetical protein